MDTRHLKPGRIVFRKHDVQNDRVGAPLLNVRDRPVGVRFDGGLVTVTLQHGVALPPQNPRRRPQ